MEDMTYDVRVYKTRVYEGRKFNTHTVRWAVAGREWNQPFRNKAQAESFRADIVAATRKGEAFHISTGRPISWKREEPALTWFAFTKSYVDVKWPYASPNHRRGIAEALTDATEALLATESGAPCLEVRRAALRWAYSTRIRDDNPPPELTTALRWLEANTIPLATLDERGKGAVLARSALDRISRKKDGTTAAASTAQRKRMTLNNAMEYAVEIGLLKANPLKNVKWTKPKTVSGVDPQVVINTDQARRFLGAVRKHGKLGERMEAFFGCMYYAALRPEEAVDLRREQLVSLPDSGWGEMRLTHATPRAGSRWTDSGKVRERKALKHRADGETRRVPIHPDLVTLLRAHLKEYGTGPGGRVFIGPRGGIMTDRAYLKVFHEARGKAFNEDESASPVMDVPYALRHAAVSTWLNAGVPATQVAEWAGHSVDVLLKVYAKCVHGQDTEAMRRIWDATSG